MAESKFYEHGKKLMNFKIHLFTRVSILNSIVHSRLTYGCQTWTLTQEQKSRLDAAYLSMLRKMIRGGIRKACGQLEIQDDEREDTQTHALSRSSQKV